MAASINFFLTLAFTSNLYLNGFGFQFVSEFGKLVYLMVGRKDETKN